MNDVPQSVKDWWFSLTERERRQWELIAKKENERINREKERKNHE